MSPAHGAFATLPDELLTLAQTEAHKWLFEDNIKLNSHKEKGNGLLYIFKHYTASHATSSDGEILPQRCVFLVPQQ